MNSKNSTHRNPDAALKQMREIAFAIKKDTGLQVGVPTCSESDNGTLPDIYGEAINDVYKNGIPKRLKEELN